MAASPNGDRYSQQICELLRSAYLPQHERAQVYAYRYNSACVRVRVIDPDFRGKNVGQREALVWKVLDGLPEKVRADISMLLLLTPRESKDSLLSLEFDDRTPSRL